MTILGVEACRFKLFALAGTEPSGETPDTKSFTEWRDTDLQALHTTTGLLYNADYLHAVTAKYNYRT